MAKLMIMDGNSLANRAFYALPPLTDRNGFHTHAIFGFCTMALRILAEEQPTHWIVVFDAAKRNFRHDLYAEYKGQREKTPSELGEQFPVLKELLREVGVCVIEQAGYEADDLIGTLVTRASAEGTECLIISGDKDLLQLVDPRVSVGLTRKGISEMERYTPAMFFEKYGLQPKQMIDLKALMGDTSDNIPGVPGIGEKTALKLLHQYQDVENVLARTGELKGKQQEQLQANADIARLSKTLATIHLEVPMDQHWSEGIFHGMNGEVLKQWFAKLQFKTLLDKIPSAAIRSVDASETSSLATSRTLDFHWLDVQDPQQMDAFEGVLPTLDVLILDAFGDNPHHAKPIAAAWSDGTITYLIRGGDWNVVFARSAIQQWAQSETRTKIVHDLNRTLVIADRYGLTLKGVSFDTLLAAYLLDPTRNETDVSALVAFANEIADASPDVVADEAVYGKGAKFAVPADAITGAHLTRKAYALKAAVLPLQAQLEAQEMHQLYYDLELPLASVLARLERTGIAVDREGLIHLGKEFQVRIDDLVAKIYTSVGTTFNLNSPKQLGEILFEKLNLPPVKKTKTGYSTDADVLEKLAPYHEAVGMILDYRTVAKLQSTYVEGLQNEIHATTGRIHTYFHQTLTATGRLSSQYPNLQNIPIRIEEGRQLRRVFVPREAQDGWRLLAADYSQIELRVLAHMAGDAALIHAFQHDLDIHTQTAATVFGVSSEQVDANMRRQAKAVNFGIVYGMSDFGLSQNLNITRKAAGQFIEQYFAAFPGVKAYMENVVTQAKQDGYVSTLLHRRRYLPDLRSSNFNARSFAERMAMNTPIQGSAADLIKLAMVHLNDWMQAQQLRSRMLLQVHDELVFEAAPEELDLLRSKVKELMESAYDLAVPLRVEINDGANWYETK